VTSCTSLYLHRRVRIRRVISSTQKTEAARSTETLISVILLRLFYETTEVLHPSADLFINSVRTSQETHYVSVTKPNRLMLFRETVAVYCENHTEQKYTLGRIYVTIKMPVHIVTIRGSGCNDCATG
jgi:hypothetical protein